MKKRLLTRRRIAWIAVSILLASCLVGTAYAQRDNAIAKAAGMFLGLSSRGFDTIRSEDSDRLSPGQSMKYTVTLYAGVTYVLFAAGDASIRDLDIYLYDENGNLISKDTQTDRYPVVTVTPRWTGPFRMYVKNHRGRRGWYHSVIAY